MGRMIGGIVVGFLAMGFVAIVLNIALPFALGAEAIIEGEDRTPTSLWMGIGVFVSLAAAYIGGAVGRLVGKTKSSVYWLIGIIAASQVIGIIRMGSTELPEPDPRTPEIFLAVMDAAANAPSWATYLSLAAGLIGMALGGLKLSDFKKTEDPSPTE